MTNKRVNTPYLVRFFIFSLFFVAIGVVVIASCSRLGMPLSYFFDYKNADSHSGEQLYIIIDAGHGGEDGGASSSSGILEKDLNLDIAKKLYTLLKTSDYTPVLVRDTDRLMYRGGQENRKKFYDIQNRIEFTEDYRPAIFISVHQNKFPIEKYSGFQMYYSRNNLESKIIAEIIQNNVVANLQPENKRVSKEADNKIKLLDRLQIPAVLAECGFLSNAKEAELLNTVEYRNKISFLLYASILEYLDNQEKYEKQE